MAVTARRTRREAQETNRAAVLQAARELFEELGYHRATLDAIAARAGFSKGAVYSRFASKDDLFLAVLEENVDRRHAEMAERMEERRAAGVAELAQAALDESVQSLAWQAAVIEFRVHAWRHPEVNERYTALHRTTIEMLTSLIADARSRAGATDATDREQTVHAFAATNGLLLELMADPTLDLGAMTDLDVRLAKTTWEGR
jgi:AcrR family transcriptional regulator